jgi:hypothetical protein
MHSGFNLMYLFSEKITSLKAFYKISVGGKKENSAKVVLLELLVILILGYDISCIVNAYPVMKRECYLQ